MQATFSHCSCPGSQSQSSRDSSETGIESVNVWTQNYDNKSYFFESNEWRKRMKQEKQFFLTTSTLASQYIIRIMTYEFFYRVNHDSFLVWLGYSNIKHKKRMRDASFHAYLTLSTYSLHGGQQVNKRHKGNMHYHKGSTWWQEEDDEYLRVSHNLLGLKSKCRDKRGAPWSTLLCFTFKSVRKETTERESGIDCLSLSGDSFLCKVLVLFGQKPTLKFVVCEPEWEQV